MISNPRRVALAVLIVALLPAAYLAKFWLTPSAPKVPHISGMTAYPGVWVEGPGYDITYGGDYETCARRCLADPRCRMIEFYRPEKKCNHYDSQRPRLKGGDSNVAVRD